MVEKVDCVVIGAGVVGLAVARELSLAGREVIVLEREETIGTHTSSRNSEVVHAGIYYPRGSLKAKFCVAGKKLLYEYCAERNVEHSRLGKLIVATDQSEVEILETYIKKAHDNGVRDLRWVNSDEFRRLEPAVRGQAAVFSPSTGIIDSHGLMLALQGDAEATGTMFAFKSPVTSGRCHNNELIIDVGGVDPMVLKCKAVVNCGGLFATHIARKINGIPQETIPKPFYAKAHYFTLSGKSPFNHLIYPVAKTSTYLGVHVTLDLGGQARFGPDITWIDDVDYEFDETREVLFYEAIRQYFPDLKPGTLVPGYTGVRPKISGPDSAAADFLIHDEKAHGIRGLVNLFGIESPGLTSSLAIAKEITRKI